MFSKCIYCDKLHLCTYREKYHKANVSPRCREQLSEAILPLIPEDARLRRLFQRWSQLTASERATVDEQVTTRDYADLYVPLKKAMVVWEKLQDTQGAPGFEQGLYTFTCDTRLEEDLLNVMYKMDQLVESISGGDLKVSPSREDDPFNSLKEYTSTKAEQWALIPNPNANEVSSSSINNNGISAPFRGR